VLKRIFQPKKERVTTGWAVIHTEEFHNLCSSPNIKMIKSSNMRWMGNVTRCRERRNVYTVLIGKPPARNRPFGRPRRRWEDNIKKIS
jgi:hypothetical protein